MIRHGGCFPNLVMPSYQYQCNKCRESFTQFERIDAHVGSQAPPCPSCGSRDVIQSFAGIFVKTSRKS